MLTYATEPPPLVADLSHTHAQYLPFKRSILRAERTKKSSVRNSRVLSVQVHDAHTQQVMTFTTEMCNKPLTQTYMFRLQKCRFSNAIVPLLHTNSAAITHQKRHYYTPKAPLLENKGVISAHPINPGGRIFDSTENLYLCAMNNQGLLALAQLILPSEILTNFEVVRVEEEASLIRIYLDESVKAEYKENPEIESKGFCEAVTIRDFPIRDKGVDLIVRRRKWYDKQNNRYFSDSYELKAEGTRYSKEFAAFLKGVYGDDSYDLPFA